MSKKLTNEKFELLKVTGYSEKELGGLSESKLDCPKLAVTTLCEKQF